MAEDLKLDPLVLPDTVPELYIDGYAGAIVASGSVKLNLYSARLPPDLGEPQRVLVTRLTMSLATLVSMDMALHEFVTELKKQGLITVSPEPQAKTKPQDKP